MKNNNTQYNCEVCKKPLTKHEIDDSQTYIGNHYYCEKHLNQKMDLEVKSQIGDD